MPAPVDFTAISPTFGDSLIISFLILSSFVSPHIHRCIHISATGNLFSCAFFNISAPFIQCSATSVLYSFPKGSSRSFSSPNTPHILIQFFQPFCTLWVSFASSFSSSDNVYRRYVIVFTFFTVSYCKWIWGIAREKCSCPQPILQHTTCPAGSPWCENLRRHVELTLLQQSLCKI